MLSATPSIRLFLWPILGLLSLLLTNCRGDQPTEEAVAALRNVSLVCEALEAQDNTPRSAVYAMIDERKVKLAELAACTEISSVDYDALGIPADAIVAVGGAYADEGKYLYSRIEDRKLYFYIGGVDAQSKGKTRYAPLAVYHKRKFELLRPLYLADLAGYYMHQGVDTSYVLFLGLKGPNLVAKLFATGEPIPAQKVLQRALPKFAATEDLPFDCDLNTLTFDSSLGEGRVYWQQDSAAVVFQQFMGVEQPLEFELMTY